MIYILLLILTGALTTSASYEYDINMEITCVEPIYHPETNVYLGCTKHRQSGTLKRDTECFPGDIMVATPTGNTRMDKLKIGDKVLGWNGKVVETEIVFWLHRIINQEFEFNKIITKNGSISASGLHNIAYKHRSLLGNVWYKYSDNFKVSDFLIGISEYDKVVKIKNVKNTGLFAPQTSTGNLFVGYGTTYLAHTFANIKMPTLYTSALNNLISIVSFWNPEINKLTNNTNYIHPVAAYLLDSHPAKVVVDKYRERRSSNNYNSNSDDENDEEEELEIIMSFVTGSNIVSVLNPPIQNLTV
jgi:hypothetical protein